MSSRNYSIVEYYAEHEGYRCGYCKSSDTNYSHGKKEIKTIHAVVMRERERERGILRLAS
jgi:hypothetical protein